MQKQSQPQKIVIGPPKIHPIITNIGHGNPRYNSMLSYKESLFLPVGSTLRLTNLIKNQILFNKQIGQSQIMALQQNSKYIVVANFEGLITMIGKDGLEIQHQFPTEGKEIKHIACTDQLIAVACSLTDVEYKSKLQIYNVSNIQKKKYKPEVSISGDYYYPEIVNGQIIAVECNDPNPKDNTKGQATLWKKLPVKHRIVKFNNKLEPSQSFDLQIEGDITCTIYNPTIPTIFYLHNGKKLTAFNPATNKMISHTNEKEDKGMPLCLGRYEKGVVYAAGPNILGYLYQDGDILKRQSIEVKSLGVGGNLSIYHSQQGFYLFNQTGLHLYSPTSKQNHQHNTFHKSNCGLSFSPDGNHFAVADQVGKVHMFATNSKSMIPEPREVVEVGIPVRSLVWCRSADRIVIGCVDGSMFDWKELLPLAKKFDSHNCSINVLRSMHGNLFVGTSNGFVHIYNEKTLQKVHSFKAHPSGSSQTGKQSNGNLIYKIDDYVEIWSLAISPTSKNPLIIVSSSQDQTQTVHQVQQNKEELLKELKGHQRGVTSIDWKVMGAELGQIYVSCSDDKVVIFRNPEQDFEIMFEIETSTIKEWHTLTYLCLQPNGHRVAIGSQSGYVFIYDIASRQLIYGEKVHMGGIEGMDWKKNKLCTISSDRCINIMELN